MTHFLQSTPWQRFQETLGRSTYRAEGPGWSFLAICETGTGNSRLYTPYGPEFDSLEALDGALAELTALGRREGATFVRIEPRQPIDPSELTARGLRPVSYLHLQPEHTWLVDLEGTEADVLGRMSKSTRNLTRNYAAKGISIRSSVDPDEIAVLTGLLAGVARRNDITVHSEDYFRSQASSLMPDGAARLFIAEFEGAPIAAALVYDHDGMRTYAHAAADDQHRKLAAGTALLGALILDAHERGMHTVDLYGVAPEDEPDHPWAGFTRFKKSFGGSGADYAGAWDLPLKRLRYALYRAYQSRT